MNIVNIVKFAKNIEKNNKKFEKLSASEKRVAVAKDALGQLLLGRTVGQTGIYCRGGSKRLGDDHKIAKLPKCNVCAVGACLLSAFRLEDRVIGDVAQYGSPEDGGVDLDRDLNVDEIDSYFSADQLSKMEACFENSLEDDTGDVDYDNFWFDSPIKNDSQRLFAILSNVIENDGDFDVEQFKALDAKKVSEKYKAARAKAREVKAS